MDISSLHRSPSRFLYATAYIQEGCPQGQPPEGTNVDNTVGTWISCYIILAIGLIGSLVLYHQLRNHANNNNNMRNSNINYNACDRNTSTGSITPSNGTLANRTTMITINQRRRWALMFYLMLTALGFGMAGFGHQFVTNEIKQASLARWTRSVSYSLLLLSLAGLVLGITKRLLLKQDDTMVFYRLETGVLHLTHSSMISLSYVLAAIAVLAMPYPLSLTFAGIVILVTNGLLCLCSAVTFLRCHYHAVLRDDDHHEKEGNGSQNDVQHVLNSTSCGLFAVSTALVTGGVVIQHVLSPTCGNGGYADCFQHCILPYEWNHNFLFHTLQAISTVLVILGGLLLPSQQIESSFLPQQQPDETSPPAKFQNSLMFSIRYW